jgi:hypothetical protein
MWGLIGRQGESLNSSFMQKILLLLLTCLSFFKLSAQKETSNWYFGYRSALSFESQDPIPRTDGVIKAVQGTAVASNKDTGELLFYTDGRNFWNRHHQLMQNTHSLPFNCYSNITQPAIILPSNKNDFLFHVFCIRPSREVETRHSNSCAHSIDKTNIPPGESGLNLYYYLIDMRLANGLGNVVEGLSNIIVQTNVVEKITAIPHANGEDFWVLTHEWMSSAFYAFHFSEPSIVDVVSTEIGSVHGAYGGLYFEDEMRGELKASPDGRRVVTAVYSEARPFDLFNFDATTGSFSNYVNLGNIAGQYGVSFSPDNSKLYVSSDSRATSTPYRDIILQFDLGMEDPGSIAASAKSIIVNNPRTNLPPSGVIDGWSTVPKGMALAPDGRLYVSGNEPRDEIDENHILVVIDKPNKPGFECDVNFRRFNFGSGKTGVGLPNFMQSYFNGLESHSLCNEPSAILLFPNPATDSLRINFLAGCNPRMEIDVVNSLGQQVSSFSIDSPSGLVLDLSQYASGVYFFIIRPLNRKKIIKRIVKV